jgi:ATP-dependent DNA ligase
MLETMLKAFELCLPTNSAIVPSGPEWFHEIKYDGYRLRVERDADRVRLITKGGYDWAKQYPRIVKAALKNRQKRFVIDGARPSCAAPMTIQISTPCISASTGKGHDCLCSSEAPLG